MNAVNVVLNRTRMSNTISELTLNQGNSLPQNQKMKKNNIFKLLKYFTLSALHGTAEVIGFLTFSK